MQLLLTLPFEAAKSQILNAPEREPAQINSSVVLNWTTSTALGRGERL